MSFLRLRSKIREFLLLAESTKRGVVDLGKYRQSQKRQLLEQLFVRHGPDLRAFLVARLGVTEEKGLEDIIQEVFIRLVKMDRFPQELQTGEQKGVSYMIAMAHNLVIDLERRNARRKRIWSEAIQEQRDEAVFDATPESAAIAGEELERIKQVIDRMRPKWRRVFVSSRFKYMSYKDIARDMGISVKQVEKHMQNALICIRKAAKEFDRECP